MLQTGENKVSSVFITQFYNFSALKRSLLKGLAVGRYAIQVPQ